MKNSDRQLILDTQNYRNGKMWGKNDYCKYCWACYHGEKCIAESKARSLQFLCVKAKDRMEGMHTPTKIEEILMYEGKPERHYRMLGLKKIEMIQE